MSKTRHTPGPWSIRKHWNDDKHPTYLIAEERGYVLETTRANASLIAAAPEMFEALEYALHELTEIGSPYSKSVIQEIKSVLAKAKGEGE